MRGKLIFVTGAAVGYVLGARAGRKRYEQIKGAALKIWGTPGIQRQVHQAQDYAARKIGEVPGALFDGAKRAATALASRGERNDPAGGQGRNESASRAGRGGSSSTGSTRSTSSMTRTRSAEARADAESEPSGE